jgi:hypothetical protein
MSSRQSKNKPQILRPVKKTVSKKAGPTENLQFELLKDKAVGDYLRLTLGTPGHKTSEMILHHPIGVTDLEDDDWVLSSPEEVAQLKSRSKDPNENSIQAKRTEYVRQKAVDDKKIEIKDGTVFYYGIAKEDRSMFLEGLKKKTLQKHENESNYKFILELALNEADQSDASVKAEKDFRQWVGPIRKEAEKLFPQVFRTAKGSLEDIPQAAIDWLKAKKITEVGAQLIKHGVSGPVADSGEPDNDDFTIDGASGAANQWFFFKSGSKAEKKKIRDSIANIRKEIGLNFRVVIDDM